MHLLDPNTINLDTYINEMGHGHEQLHYMYIYRSNIVTLRSVSR